MSRSHYLRGCQRMGKCVVVNEPFGAADYIIPGESGIIVPPRDPAALRLQFISLLEKEGLASAVGARAKSESAAKFSPRAYYSAVKDIVDGLIALS